MSELAQESISTNDFEKWLNERNNWLQTAAKHLIENKRLPNEVELTELVRLCKLFIDAMRRQYTCDGWNNYILS